MSTGLLDQRAILIDLSASDRDEALNQMAHTLEELGYVEASYAQAILDREAEFSTGLPGYGRGVAIPHADPHHVKASVMAVATLKRPVAFRMMGNHDETIDAEVIFMLALKESHSHMSVLQSLMDVIQNEDLLTKIKEATTQKELYELLRAHIA